MNNDERDIMLIEMHGDLKVIRGKIDEHNATLYGPDGIVKSVTLVRDRQKNCVARKRETMEGKRLSISTVVMVVGILSFLATVIVAIWK